MRTPKYPDLERNGFMYTHIDAKARATKLRAIMNDLGHEIAHSHALEAIARMQGYRDWNTCSAALDKKAAVLPIPKGWKASGDLREHYDVGLDQSILHDGLHPAVIRYRETSPKEGTGFATFMQSFDAGGYKGQRMQFSSTLKCEDCDGAVTIWLRADSNSRRNVAFDNMEERGLDATNGPISGTTDWTTRTIVLDIPIETESISLGFYVRGKGVGYAAGFSMNPVSKDIPTTAGKRDGFSEPINMALLPDGDGNS